METVNISKGDTGSANWTTLRCPAHTHPACGRASSFKTAKLERLASAQCGPAWRGTAGDRKGASKWGKAGTSWNTEDVVTKEHIHPPPAYAWREFTACVYTKTYTPMLTAPLKEQLQAAKSHPQTCEHTWSTGKDATQQENKLLI